MLLKHQQFEDHKYDKIELRRSKCQQLDAHDNKEKQSLNMYKGESVGNKYIFLLFVAYFLPQIELNHLSDLSKRIKSFYYHIYILKIG